eukprot:scaffold162241_cov31-Tisochrysis_lutea.AAC.1
MVSREEYSAFSVYNGLCCRINTGNGPYKWLTSEERERPRRVAGCVDGTEKSSGKPAPYDSAKGK